MTAIGMLTLDCADLHVMRTFWSAALEAESTEAYGEFVIIMSTPSLILRSNPDSEESSSGTKFHLDLVCEDRRDEVDRLVALGAAQVSTIEMCDTSWTVMVDPEGNNFCVCSSNFIPHGLDSSTNTEPRPTA